MVPSVNTEEGYGQKTFPLHCLTTFGFVFPSYFPYKHLCLTPSGRYSFSCWGIIKRSSKMQLRGRAFAQRGMGNRIDPSWWTD